MAIDGLTEKQEKFLRTYLGNSIFSRKSDKKKTASYKTYLAISAEAQEIFDRLNALTPEAKPIGDALSSAAAQSEGGQFDLAAQGAESALSMARELDFQVRAAQSKSQAIIALLDTKVETPAGATPEETAALQAKRDTIRNLLAADLPTDTDIADAETQVRALIQTDIPAVAAAVADRAARTERSERKTALLAQLNGDCGSPAQATPEEEAALEGYRTEIRDLLSEDAPETADLDSAAARVAALKDTHIPAVAAAVADRGARVARKTDILARLGNVTDPDGAGDVSQAHLAGLRNDITALLDADVPETGDLDSAETKLTALISTEIPKITAQVEKARKDLGAKVAPLGSKITQQHKRLSRLTSHDDHGDMVSEADALKTITDTASGLVGAGGETECAQSSAALDGAATRLAALDAKTNVAVVALAKAELADSGVTDKQKDALAALATGSIEAFEAAKKVLDDLHDDLGDAEANPAAVVAQNKVIEAKQAEEAVILKEFKALKADFDKKVADWKAADLASQGVQDQLDAELLALAELKEGAGDALNDPTSSISVQVAAAEQKIAEKQAVMETRATALSEARASKLSWDAKGVEGRALVAEIAAEKTKLQKLTAKKMLVDAVSFGPLSQVTGKPLDPALGAELIPLFGKSPVVANEALKQAALAKNPESVVKCAGIVGDRIEGNFGHGENACFPNSFCSERYAKRLLAVSASCDPETVDGLEDYLASGRHMGDRADLKGTTSQTRTKARTEAVGTALVTRDGEGNLDFDGARSAVMDVLFHPSAVADSGATPVLGTHMLETLDWLEANPEQVRKVDEMSEPNASACDFFARVKEKDAGDVDKADAQQGVLQAMMTPIYQGRVGSCFATSGVLQMRHRDPGKILDHFVEMSSTGMLTPEQGDAVPIVQNVKLDEDPLVRSLEYSVAAATAHRVNSNQRNNLQTQAQRGAAGLQGKIDASRWNEVKARISNAILNGFTFTYDPNIEVARAGDGSSDKGRHVLMEISPENRVRDMGSFVAAVGRIVKANLQPEDCADGITVETVMDGIDPAGFADGFKLWDKYPWELSSGGQTDEASGTLFGGNVQTHPYMTEVNPDTVDKPARAKEVITGFLNNFGGRSEDMVAMRTVGQHGFTGLPMDPSLAPLLAGDPPDFEENIRKELLEPGAAIKDAELSVERVQYMFEEDALKYAKSQKRELAKPVLDKARAQAPTVAMKPAEYQAHVTQVLSKALAEVETDAWKAKQLEDSGVAPGEDEVLVHKTEQEEKARAKAQAIAEARLINELPVPQFTISDTNWGSGSSHEFFVIAPDPTTGLPRLYQKSDPPGTLRTRSDENKWLAKAWARVEE